MGVYMYKVTAKTKILSNGTKANIAVFAYKPWSGWREEDEKANRSMHKQSGCYAAEVYVRNSKNYTGQVVMGEDGEVAVSINRGSFMDYEFDKLLERQRTTGGPFPIAA